MNKYQEALDRFEETFRNVTLDDNLTNERRDLIQELIDRETPMKPYYPTEYPSACCPKCFQNLGDNNFCRNCGQRVDWSEENERN